MHPERRKNMRTVQAAIAPVGDGDQNGGSGRIDTKTLLIGRDAW
jgi:hypothetical protein